jgi:hypothetical protein
LYVTQSNCLFHSDIVDCVSARDKPATVLGMVNDAARRLTAVAFGHH